MTRTRLEELGPYLTAGLGYKEIGERLQPPRSEDYVATNVAKIRQAIAENVLANAADDLAPEMRARLEAFAAGRMPTGWR